MASPLTVPLSHRRTLKTRRTPTVTWGISFLEVEHRRRSPILTVACGNRPQHNGSPRGEKAAPLASPTLPSLVGPAARGWAAVRVPMAWSAGGRQVIGTPRVPGGSVDHNQWAARGAGGWGGVVETWGPEEQRGNFTCGYRI
ncbi:hypothetical protein GW17_00008460 [Ensete ventricosum]|nr:hypothetical protein GW17_00008460 [Ensete ventricosum]